MGVIHLCNNLKMVRWRSIPLNAGIYLLNLTPFAKFYFDMDLTFFCPFHIFKVHNATGIYFFVHKMLVFVHKMFVFVDKMLVFVHKMLNIPFLKFES